MWLICFEKYLFFLVFIQMQSEIMKLQKYFLFDKFVFTVNKRTSMCFNLGCLQIHHREH